MGNSSGHGPRLFGHRQPSPFIEKSVRSFLERHKNSRSLISQINELYRQGAHDSCLHLIEVICEMQHPLCETAELYVLGAKIAFEEDDDLSEVESWLMQGELNDPSSPACFDLSYFLSSLRKLKDGLYSESTQDLLGLVDSTEVGFLSSYLLGRHFLWKSQETQLAIYHLQTALQSKPNFKKALEAIGFAYNREGQTELASAAFSKCIELETDPDKIEFYRQHLAS